MKRDTSGFSLIELIIVIGILIIFISIAVPSYNEYVFKSNRSDAITALLNLHLAQERWRAQNASYTHSLDDIWVEGSNKSSQGFYELSIDVAKTNKNEFLMTATAIAQQANDEKCKVFRITQNGADKSTAEKSKCWGR